jgi:hypothetical protein
MTDMTDLWSELYGMEEIISEMMAKQSDESSGSESLQIESEAQSQCLDPKSLSGELQKAQGRIRRLIAENHQIKSQLDLANEEVLRLQKVISASQSAERIIEKIVHVEIPVEKVVRLEVPVDKFVEVPIEKINEIDTDVSAG